MNNEKITTQLTLTHSTCSVTSLFTSNIKITLLIKTEADTKHIARSFRTCHPRITTSGKKAMHIARSYRMRVSRSIHLFYSWMESLLPIEKSFFSNSLITSRSHQNVHSAVWNLNLSHFPPSPKDWSVRSDTKFSMFQNPLLGEISATTILVRPKQNFASNLAVISCCFGSKHPRQWHSFLGCHIYWKLSTYASLSPYTWN